MSRAIWKRDGGRPAPVIDALNETGLPWQIEPGTKHRKIMVAGKMVGVVSLKGINGHNGDCRNIIAAIKRAAR